MEIITSLLGGLGLFIYGMNVMAGGLEKSAGNRLKKFIEILTSNIIMAVIVGAVVTAIIQSSSATTVMIVGFVNAGIMSLKQAVGVIMGANIGTTVTAQLVSIDLSFIAPFAVAVGVGLWLFTKNNKIKNVAEIFIGFGVLFIGMELMKDSVEPLKGYEGFTNLLLRFGRGNAFDKFLGIFAGFLFTAIIQSSSATTGILVAFAAKGIMPIESAFPVVLGANIGTCVTAIISGIGANKTAKKAALIHLLFNVIGSMLFIFFLGEPTIRLVSRLSADPKRQLANAHTLFNVINTLLILPFSSLLVLAVNKILPSKEEEEILGIKYIDDRFLGTPSIALAQVIKEVIHMGNITLESYKKAMESFFNADYNLANETFRIERVINQMEREITSYLVKISGKKLSASDRAIIESLYSTVNDIERVGDHADNIAELTIFRIENKLKFSNEAIDEIKYMHSRVEKSYIQALQALEARDEKVARRVLEREGEIDLMEKNLRANHIARLSAHLCVPASGVIFLDIISNLERIGDHASNIALSVLDINKK